MFENGFRPLITKPTRITTTSSTAIDHIWTNVYNSKTCAGIIVDCIADHLPVTQCCQLGSIKEMAFKKEQRCYSNQNICTFVEKLSTLDTTSIMGETEVNKTYNLFGDNYSKIFPLSVLIP